jgi:glycosyltransferase involved in cell wall biosynthesis
MKTSVQDAFGLPPTRVFVFPAPARRLRRGEPLPTGLRPMLDVPPDARLLYVGSDAPYKNVEIVIKGLERLRERSRRVTLFVTWPSEHPACRTPGIVGLGYLDAPSLAAAYDLATVLVQPSLVETSCLPLHEAMACGCPLLVADRAYAREECGDAADYFDPHSAPDFLGKATALLDDEARRSELAARGRVRAAERTSSDPYRTMVDTLGDFLPLRADGAPQPVAEAPLS